MPFNRNPATHSGIFPTNDSKYIFYNDGIHGGCVGTNSGFGKLFYGIDMNWTQSWTISAWIKRNKYGENHANRALFGVYYSSSENNSLHIGFRYDKPFTGFYSNDLLGNNYILDGNWHHYAFVWDGINQLIYVDGELDSQRVATDGALNGSINEMPFEVGSYSSGLYQGCHIFSDVRIDDIARREDEIKIWYDYNNRFYIPYNGGFELTKAHIGSNLIIKNSLIGVDDSVIAYYPFKNSANDIITGTEPITNSNTTITENGITVEEGTTNLVPYPTDFTVSTTEVGWDARDYVSLTYGVLDPFGLFNAVKIHPLSTLDNYFGIRKNLSDTGVFTTSIWLKATKNCTVKIRTGTGSLAGGHVDCDANLTTEWKKIIYTGEITVSPTHTFHIGGWKSWTDNSFDVYMAYPQVEKKSFATSFVDGSRGDGSLTINNPFQGTAGSLHIKAQMTNGEDYSVQYKSLFGNVWSDNAFFMFASKSSDGILYGYHPNTSNLHTYFNVGYYPQYLDEFTITLTWNGTTFKYYLNGELKGTHTDCDSARIANSFTELHLGSHPSYNTFGIIKEFSVYNRALSDNEVLKLYLNSNSFYYSNEEVTF